VSRTDVGRRVRKHGRIGHPPRKDAAMDGHVEIDRNRAVIGRAPGRAQPAGLGFETIEFRTLAQEARGIVHGPFHQAKPEDLFGTTGRLGKVRPAAAAAAAAGWSRDLAAAASLAIWALK